MWGVAQDYTGILSITFGRASFGIPHQPRPTWRSDSFNIYDDLYPSSGWAVSDAISINDPAVGAVWLACQLSRTSYREVKITLGDCAARLRFVQWIAGSENGATEFRSYASTGTVDYLVLELLQNETVTQSRILHSAGNGRAALCCGFALVNAAYRFVCWGSATASDANTLYGSIGHASYGACTAVASVEIEGEPDIVGATKTIEGSPSLRIIGAAEHYGPLPESHTAIPEPVATLLARADGPPGALRQRQQNALVPVDKLPRFDCGQMIELSRNSNESFFFVQSLAAYDYSESMPYLPSTQASNLHDDPSVNERLQRLQLQGVSIVPNVGEVSFTVTCTNDGSGLNEYRGSSVSGETNVAVLISLFRQNVNTGLSLSATNLTVVYSMRVAVKATHPSGTNFSNTYKLGLTTAEQSALFSGTGSVSIGGRQVSAIGPA